jgi:hypothetical protein
VAGEVRHRFNHEGGNRSGAKRRRRAESESTLAWRYLASGKTCGMSRQLPGATL